VFSKMNILELNLPVDGGPPPVLPAVLELEVIVRQGVIEVASVKFLNALHERKMDPESQQEAARQPHRPVEAGVRGARA